MPYIKQTWVDGSTGGTPVNAARLNYIEAGIEAAGTGTGGGGTAATTTYDPASSPSLAATNVQTAIDEIVADYQAADTAAVTAARNGVLLATDVGVLDRGHGLENAEETMSRTAMSGNFNVTTGTLQLSYFTPRVSRTVGTLELITAGAGASPTPTLVRFGLYSVDGSGNLTLVGSSVSDTTLLTAASTVYAKALSASVSLTKGARYAVGVLQVGATTPAKVYGVITVGAVNGRAPALAHSLAAQTDLPASIAVGTLAATTGMAWAAAY